MALMKIEGDKHLTCVLLERRKVNVPSEKCVYIIDEKQRAEEEMTWNSCDS